jgi:hypothetical protein
MASAEAWHGLVEHAAGAGGGVIVDELLLLVVAGAVLLLLREVELELLDGAELELLEELALEVLDDFVEVTEAVTDAHGVVGLALAQAQRELAAPNTPPADVPQALMTQFRALD